MDIKESEPTKSFKQRYPFAFADESLKNNKLLMKRYETAWEIAKKISVILKDDFGADKVVVFGSLTERDLFTHWSDIDIAAWGIPDKRFYEAVGVVTGLTKEFNIDLIDATDCRFSLHKTIENEGIDI